MNTQPTAHLDKFVGHLVKDLKDNPESWHALVNEDTSLQNRLLGVHITNINMDVPINDDSALPKFYLGEIDPINEMTLPQDHRVALWRAALPRRADLTRRKAERILNESNERARLWMNHLGIS